MKFFLVLLFWNPAIQDFDVANGWAPIPFETMAICQTRMEYVEQYLPNYAADIEYIVDCAEAYTMDDAVSTVRGTPKKGQGV